MNDLLQESSMKLANQLLNPKITPKKSTFTLTDLDEVNAGELVYVADTNQIYLKTDVSGLVQISSAPIATVESVDRYDYRRYRELDNQVLRCKSCNSVIDSSKVDKNNNVTCPYCNSVNHIFEKR